MIPVTETSLTRAWIASTEELSRVGGDAFSLVVSITNPREPEGADARVRTHLDKVLVGKGLQDTQAVANTIFPQALAKGHSAQQLFETYRAKTYPVLRRFPPNRRGTYFLRLIQRDSHRTPQVISRNPLAELIDKVRGELARSRGTIRCAYELAVYDPLDDAAVWMGFPCLSHISLKLDPPERRLHLTALYRNQQYIERAYGNFLGLARLQAFIASETGLTVGEMVCHATHAEIDHLGKKAVHDLLGVCRRMLDQPQAPPS
jgi:hypothetical protein